MKLIISQTRRAVRLQSGSLDPHRARVLLFVLLDRAGLGEAVHGRQDGGEQVFIVGVQRSTLPLNQQKGVS